MGSLNLGQAVGSGGIDPIGTGTTGLIPEIELGEELNWGDEGITLFWTCDLSVSSDRVTSDSSSSVLDRSLSVSASDNNDALLSSSVMGPRTSTSSPEVCPFKCFVQRSGPNLEGGFSPLAARAEPLDELDEIL